MLFIDDLEVIKFNDGEILLSLSNNDNYIKLKEQDKLKILKLLNLENNDDTKVAYQICKNCLYNEKLTKRTLILSRMNLNTGVSSNKSLSKYKNMIHDKTLPHTRDYVCKNKRGYHLNPQPLGRPDQKPVRN